MFHIGYESVHKARISRPASIPDLIIIFVNLAVIVISSAIWSKDSSALCLTAGLPILMAKTLRQLGDPCPNDTKLESRALLGPSGFCEF
jgi:hypothetical protein